ncbi:small RNA 2-O-methyltransferase [Prunus yedoensis var. nudiflora]|uniref:Small RNA 2'-O-methyltransferase n=1 Tax=Prunus yedoensis var. nudiflora TaxID=2094558 RepID=A0A314ZPJ8_PRUYE|nr:small RNA 2-O-methyltransferase [Prunus yedoensis var. nudiflora]
MTTFTPKAIVHKRFGSSACYKVEEVHESTQNGCPGLAIMQKGPCLYRCTLQLPEVTVVSGIFKKKKDAEHSAAELALEKLGINPATKSPSLPEAWDALVDRVSFLFSDEFLSTLHPLSGHFRAALQREGDLSGQIPASVVAVFDATLCNMCKSLDPKVESNPFLVIPYVVRAAARLSELISTSEEELWFRRQNPYAPETVESSSIQQLGSTEIFSIEAINVPSSLEKTVERVILNVSSSGYFLDVIAKQLGLLEASDVLISRPIGKASSETRLYFAAPKQYLLDMSSDLLNAKEACNSERSLNARASYLSGQDIYGDAILASIGYTWRSKDLFYEDVTLQSYHRMVIGKTPSGIYKLSRGAILAAELPLAFTTNAKWKGSFPREMLCTFCRQHRLEPVFSPQSTLEESSESPKSHKKLKVTDLPVKEAQYANGCVVAAGVKDSVESGEGPDSGVTPSNGSLSSVSYSVSLVTEGEHMKELLESSDDFEFEIASGAVIPHLEPVIMQMTVGQSAFFSMDLPHQELILAAADDSARMLSLLSSKTCFLEYTITLLRVTEPLEDRMEQALFSPPLSKQRVEYAVQSIKESCATTLVDFGCGSGSLLDSLLNYPTSLEKIAGVDISQKSLTRAAKILNSKLDASMSAINSAVLYDGSITAFDSRLSGFDIGTCLEVIEHMEEDQASEFGNVVLSLFRPRVLIVSTPNYEYNVILQKSNLSSQEDDPEDKNQAQSCKFRNHDHKFEWTREHGVGGSGDTEPGFASQIAVFRRGPVRQEDVLPEVSDMEHPYKVIWEWSSNDSSRSAPTN